MSKVLHILNEIKFSGAEVMIANAAPLFQAQGIELRAFATGQVLGDYAKEFNARGIVCEHRPVRYGMNPWKMLRYYIELYRYLKHEGISVVHVHRSDLWMICIVAYFAGLRCVKTQHNVFHNRWFTLPVAICQRFIVRTFFGTVFHSIGESVERNEREYYCNPTVRINNWYDSSRFYPPQSSQEKTELRKLLDLPQCATVVVSAGSCTHVKNHHDILRALHQLADKVDIVYLHLGCGATEAEEWQLTDELGVSGRVRFLGNQTDVRKYLAVSDIFLMPSRFEGLPIAAIESMACGLPQIVYDVPGLRDLIQNNDAGFLIPENPEMLADKILELSNDSTLRESMGAVARNRATQEYGMEASVAQLVELYRRISSLEG